jgi:RNA polymerase sigma-70 factor, ECF subfamily
MHLFESPRECVDRGMRRVHAAGALPGGLEAMIGTFVPDPVRPPMSNLPDAARRPQPVSPDIVSAESSFDLLIRAKRGDEGAMESLCVRYLPRLKRWAHGRLPGSSRGLLDTEDLAQEVLFRAIERVETFHPRHEGAFQGYVRQILLNRVRDEVRKGQRRPTAAPLEEDQHEAVDPSPLEMAIGRQALDRYEAALGRLKDQDREMIVARLELGFSAAEIASEFGKPSAAAAQMAVSRALVRLAEERARG